MMRKFSNSEAKTSSQHQAYTDMAELIGLRLPARSLSLKPDRRVLRQTAGGHLSRFRGRGIDFAEVRQYQAGDDIRSIDWRVTARRGKPHTKLFQEERERPVLIVVDQSLSQFFGSRLAFKSVRAAQTAALLAWATVGNGDRVGGIVFSDQGHQESRPGRSDKDCLRFLRALLAFNQRLNREQANLEPSFSLDQALLETRRIAKPGSLIFVISDFQDRSDDTERHLNLLAKHNDVVAVLTFDPLEAELPLGGLLGITDGRQRMVIDSDNRLLREGFQQDFTQQLERLRDRLGRSRIPLLSLSTQQQPQDVLREFFRGT